MNCYVCEKAPHLAGTRFGVRAAVGVCHHCGIGVCAEHSHKDSEPGSPLLCKTCAALAEIHDNHSTNHLVGDVLTA